MGEQGPNSSLERERILTACRELIIKWVQVNFSAYFDTLDDRLFSLADKADNNDDQNRYFQIRGDLQHGKSIVQQAYLQQIYKAFDNYQANQATSSDYSNNLGKLTEPAPEDELNLSLIDNNELEEKLAIGSMSRKASALHSEMLYALNQRLAALRGGQKLTDQGNPIAPAVFGEAMKQSIDSISMDNRSKLLIYKIFESAFISKINKLYELVNHHFESHGVLPHLSYHIQKNASAQIAEQLPEELQEQTSAASMANQVNLIDAIRLLQQQLQPQAPQPRAQASPPVSQIIAGIQQLQQNAGALLKALESPQAVATSNPASLKQQAEQAVKKSDEVDAHIIEIVGLLFEYMLNDQQLPDSIKALLSYLHTPFLKIAVIDKDFFDHPEHPARQLLNSLVAAGERWVEPSGKHKNDVFQQIKNVVQRLLNEFDNDVRLFSELAFEFNQYLRQHSRRIRLAEKRAMQAAQGENKLKEIRLKVDAYLKKKSSELQLPPSIHTLLFEPWANFLSFNLLRFGSRSEQWREAALAVDDILWLSQPHGADDWHARKRAQELRKTLLPLLQSGFETVGYDSNQGKRLLEALMQRQQDTSTAATPVTTPVSANIDDVDIASQSREAAEGDKVIMMLRKTQPGTWFEFNADSKTPQRAKLAWANTDTLHFMFVNRMGQQVSAKTGQELASDIRAGKTRILQTLEGKPFFEKAMERVLEQLRQREQNNPD
ncbi:hypothetical protein BST96_11585 [Oceanicoccus sagamiensis]|uniref:Thymidine phosphorylase n=2 Tax=Oceanicoccus sagamiensis TaxID=716816 RepID=A0A1X9NAR1_9GAMM|nr:hypothetical protein BST96_11585 [Oceanicoccus sagamiensis]